ncbi:MAG: hypothetical protein LBJ00_04280 [Planctomycetaceae bacterium]|jgi:hypothetical protein|nr:hypothetical protein [Planctomycetaceae bacterium]
MIIETINIVAEHVRELVKNDAVVVRHYLPFVETETLEAMDKPLIQVFPVNLQTSNKARNMFSIIYSVDITISKKLKERNNTLEKQLAEIDPVLNLNETIFNHFLNTVIIDKVICKTPEQLTLVDFKMIETLNVFFVAIRIKAEQILTV